MFSKVVFTVFCCLAPQMSSAELLIKPEVALKLKYGESANIEKKNIALNAAQLKKVIRLSKFPVESKIHTFYVIREKEKIKGYAALLSDIVRTHNQTLLFFIQPDGELDGAELIAYYEPPEYKVSKKWMKSHLSEKTLKDPLDAGDDLPNITGSTLTVDSVARLSRLALALWQLGFEKSNPSK